MKTRIQFVNTKNPFAHLVLKFSSVCNGEFNGVTTARIL